MELKSYTNGTVKILQLSGSFDAYNAKLARQWFEEATSIPPVQIVVNLEEVNFLDSMALSTLVQAIKRARQAKGDVRLCNLQQPVRMVFELTRLDRVFEIFTSAQDAVKAFSDESIQVS